MMWLNPYYKSILSIADEKKKFLYEFIPEFQQYGYFSDLEMELWGHFYKYKNVETAKHLKKIKRK